jgi:hypothetical protein
LDLRKERSGDGLNAASFRDFAGAAQYAADRSAGHRQANDRLAYSAGALAIAFA